jgi:hypothetical protein
MYIDKYKTADGYEMDGLFHRTAEDLIGHRLNFCGCGEPLAAIKYVGEILKGIKERSHEDWQGIFSLFPNEQIAYFVLYTLDHLKLIAHDSSINIAWLTLQGEEMLADIRELKEEE